MSFSFSANFGSFEGADAVWGELVSLEDALHRAQADAGRAAAISGGQNDDGAPHMLLRRLAIRDQRLKPAPILGRDRHGA